MFILLSKGFGVVFNKWQTHDGFLDKILGKKYKTEYNGNLFTSEFRFGVLANVIISRGLQQQQK